MDTCQEYPALARGCEFLFGEELDAKISASEFVDLASQDLLIQQAFLMNFVPVHLILRVAPAGWRLEVVQSIRYGGEPGTAPMVTWIIRYRRDNRTASIPSTVRRESIETIASSYAEINADGSLRSLTPS
jgi:hypothetical protein